MKSVRAPSHSAPSAGDDTSYKGALATLERLALRDDVVCGLVTGNVEAIARKKMRATGLYATGGLAPPTPSQTGGFGEHEWGFLGGFGSDYCSCDIDDLERELRGLLLSLSLSLFLEASTDCLFLLDKQHALSLSLSLFLSFSPGNYLDRAEQIAIAWRRAKGEYASLTRVIHVGDAPADVLAARAVGEGRVSIGEGVTVGCVGVATGSFSAEHLRGCLGEPRPGQWEPIVLARGLEEDFIGAIGL